MRILIVAVGIATALPGTILLAQADGSQRQTSGEYQKAYTEAYDKAFRTAFRSNSVEQCISSAPKAAAAGYDVTPTCTCAADRLLATETVAELKNLSAGSDLKAVTNECLKTNPPVRSQKR